ncbi:MAG TPA: hypothetical protein VE998_07445 [Terriglobales bacterium]|nr:hypothetical protein [Terriglobales bacterium]
MSSHTQALAIPAPAPFSLAPLWRDAALAAHLGVLSAAALSIGFGDFSLEMARWGMSVLVDAARAFGD